MFPRNYWEFPDPLGLDTDTAEEQEPETICGCGRPFYRSETVTDECASCYELRIEMVTRQQR